MGNQLAAKSMELEKQSKLLKQLTEENVSLKDNNVSLQAELTTTKTWSQSAVQKGAKLAEVEKDLADARERLDQLELFKVNLRKLNKKYTNDDLVFEDKSTDFAVLNAYLELLLKKITTVNGELSELKKQVSTRKETEAQLKEQLTQYESQLKKQLAEAESRFKMQLRDTEASFKKQLTKTEDQNTNIATDIKLYDVVRGRIDQLFDRIKELYPRIESIEAEEEEFEIEESLEAKSSSEDISEEEQWASTQRVLHNSANEEISEETQLPDENVQDEIETNESSKGTNSAESNETKQATAEGDSEIKTSSKLENVPIERPTAKKHVPKATTILKGNTQTKKTTQIVKAFESLTHDYEKKLSNKEKITNEFIEKLKELNARKTEVDEQVSRLSKELQNSKSTAETHKNQITTLEQTKTQLEQEITKTKESEQHIEQLCKTLKEENVKLNKENEVLTNDNQILLAARLKLDETIVGDDRIKLQLNEENAKMKQQLHTKDDQIEKLQSQLKELQNREQIFEASRNELQRILAYDSRMLGKMEDSDLAPLESEHLPVAT